jgi:ATP-binding cassette subfamily G (WHITE) protein 2
MLWNIFINYQDVVVRYSERIFRINRILQFYLGTIIFSIHQPRYSIFKLFDTLFLVAAGYCVYHGPANSVLPYFSSIGYTCEQHDNPADFLLDVTQGDRPLENAIENDSERKSEQNAHRLHDLYIKSDLYSSIQEEINNLNHAKITTATNNQTLMTKSRLSEILYVSQRTLRNVFRNPTLVAMQTIVTIFFAALVGLIYLKIGPINETGVKNRMGAIFFIVTNQVMANLSALELFLKERVLFIHENASGYYHVSTYFIAKLMCDLIPLRIIPSILFSTIVYFMIQFQQTVDKFFIFYLAIFITTTCGAAFCFFISATVEVFGIANLLTAMAFVLMMVFGGFLVELSSVVSFLSWIKWISIFRYSINIITINEFSGLQYCLKNNTHICPVNGTDIIRSIAHIEYETQWDLWKNFVALGSMTIIFLFLAYVQLLRMKKTK